jgi:hypothetical protein
MMGEIGGDVRERLTELFRAIYLKVRSAPWEAHSLTAPQCICCR